MQIHHKHSKKAFETQAIGFGNLITGGLILEMNIEQLRDYKNWVGKSSGDILASVINVGGWQNVFTLEAFPKTPTGLPRWAHRIRNFFNQEPTQLNYYQFEGTESYAYKLIKITQNLVPSSGHDYKKDAALSGHTYKDENKNIWLQMSAMATVYHFKHKLSMAEMAAQLAIRGQSGTPVFKLVSPDGSKGSRETIIFNPFKKADILLQVVGFQIPARGESTIKGRSVMNRIEKDSLYQGSYNYGETAVAGSDTHTRYDVTPHEKDPKGYVNPDNRFSNLYSRKFEEYAKGEKDIPLADQIKYP